MSESMRFEFDEESTRQIRDLAVVLQETPEEVADDIVTNGMYLLRRYAFLKRKAETVDLEEAIRMLRSKRNDNPPDPEDELPNDLRSLLSETHV